MTKIPGARDAKRHFEWWDEVLLLFLREACGDMVNNDESER